MAIGILAAVLGLLLATAAIVIPRIVARHNHPEDDAASRAYLARTGRSAEEVEQANRGWQAPPDGRPQAGSLRALTVMGRDHALGVIAGVTAAGVIASAGRRQQERELADFKAIADAAQQILLRPVPPAIPPVDIAVRYVSAAASARIGGDLYEAVSSGGGVRLIVGDALGKGASRSADGRGGPGGLP